MPPFEDGSEFEDIFETPIGPVRVLAEVHVFGRHLVLDELLFFPCETSDRLVIGVRETLAIFRQIRNLAKESGFEELTVVYHRVGKQRPGPVMSRTRRLE